MNVSSYRLRRWAPALFVLAVAPVAYSAPAAPASGRIAAAAANGGTAAATSAASLPAKPAELRPTRALTPPGYAVASAQPEATAAGIEILKAGGNAFDAAVAVSAALAVVEPYSSGLGGGGFWLLHRDADQSDVMIDGRETAPLAATSRMYLDQQGQAVASLSRNGPLAGAIPGEPAVLAYIAARYGRLGLKRDLQPAIKLARDGFAIDAMFARLTAASAPRLSPAARAVFMPGGKPPAAGTVIRQPDLAATLQALADRGAAGFYRGPIAEKLVEGVRAAGGIWTAEDLARYRVALRRPIVTYFRDYRIVSAPPPSAGGVGIAEILHQLEARGWVGGHTAGQDAMVIEAMRRAYRDRAAWLGDPDFVTMPLTRLLSTRYADFLARTTDPNRATPSSALPSPAAITGAPAPARSAREGRDTSHFSIIDAAGNRVAATLTVNLRFGSGYMAPGTGVIVNDEMDDFAASVRASNAFGLIGSRANLIAPGKRPLSSMSPTFVEGPRGILVLGTPGGSRIITMVTLGILDFVRGASLGEVVAAPRYHMQYLPDRVQFEPGAFAPSEQAALTKMGYHLQPLDHVYGNMQAVRWNPADDALTAASDPRDVGSAQVVITRAAGE